MVVKHFKDFKVIVKPYFVVYDTLRCSIPIATEA